MLTPSEVLLLTQVVTERIDNQEMFTCFDITRILRDRGCKCAHDDVRKVIHGLSGTDLPPFKNTGYFRNSTIPVRGYAANAEVYAPVGFDPYSYDPDALDPKKTQAAPAKTAGVPTASTVTQTVTTTTPAQVTMGTQPAPLKRTKVDSKRILTGRDTRGRIAIHNGFMQELGLFPGSQAFVSVRSGTKPGLVVLKKKSNSGHLATYRVDKSGNVRLTPKILKKAKLDKAKGFKMRLSDDKRAVVLVES